MNKLSTEERTRVVSALVEGNSLRAVTRMTGVNRTTVMKLLADLGRACSIFQDRVLRNLTCQRIQCDEIWSFVGAKERNVSPEKKAEGWGDVWTWTAIDAETKLIPCWYVGTRDAGAAYHFMHDLADRLAHRVQLTTDGHRPYLMAVADAFGTDIDYATLTKIYGEAIPPLEKNGREKVLKLINDRAADFGRATLGNLADQSPRLASDMRAWFELYLKGMWPPETDTGEEAKG